MFGAAENGAGKESAHNANITGNFEGKIITVGGLEIDIRPIAYPYLDKITCSIYICTIFERKSRSIFTAAVAQALPEFYRCAARARFFCVIRIVCDT